MKTSLVFRHYYVSLWYWVSNFIHPILKKSRAFLSPYFVPRWMPETKETQPICPSGYAPLCTRGSGLNGWSVLWNLQEEHIPCYTVIPCYTCTCCSESSSFHLLLFHKLYLSLRSFADTCFYVYLRRAFLSI